MHDGVEKGEHMAVQRGGTGGANNYCGGGADCGSNDTEPDRHAAFHV